MTESATLIFQTDSYARGCEAVVTGIDEDKHAIRLDRTVFYPGGGGQPADHGKLTFADVGIVLPIVSMVRLPDGPAHVIPAEEPLPALGDRVAVEIEWDRRYRLMRTHTALHVLCGVVFRNYGALVTGGNMDVDKARMDFEWEDLSPDRVRAIEEAANREIAAGREIRVQIKARDEALRIPDLIRTRINLLPKGTTEIRTVEMMGLDLQADGGTHVANTKEVGGLRVIGTRSKGRINKRLEIALIDE